MIGRGSSACRTGRRRSRARTAGRARVSRRRGGRRRSGRRRGTGSARVHGRRQLWRLWRRKQDLGLRLGRAARCHLVVDGLVSAGAGCIRGLAGGRRHLLRHLACSHHRHLAVPGCPVDGLIGPPTYAGENGDSEDREHIRQQPRSLTIGGIGLGQRLAQLRQPDARVGRNLVFGFGVGEEVRLGRRR